MMKMVKLLLAALLLQLLLQSTAGNPPTGNSPPGSPPAGSPPAGSPPAGSPPAKKDAQTQTFKYGDILAFDRGGLTHFAIYIDDVAKRFPGRDATGNLFHITGPFWLQKRISDCVFGEIQNEIKTNTMKVFNYLDGMTHLSALIKVASEADITTRINEILGNCPTWFPTTTNCEHLATYIRYGVHVSIQFGKRQEGWCRSILPSSKKLPADVETKVIEELHKLYDGQKEEESYKLMHVSVCGTTPPSAGA